MRRCLIVANQTLTTDILSAAVEERASELAEMGLIERFRCAYTLGLRAPEDLAVIGVDDTPLAPFAAPPLTTVRQDTGALAAYLAAAVVQGIAGGEAPRAPRSDAVTLVVRESA